MTDLHSGRKNNMAPLDEVIASLTKDSTVTVDRAEGDVFVDGAHVFRSLDPDPEVLESIADALCEHVQDLKAAAAGFRV